MEPYMIKENERFFNNLMNTLNEGGVWVWKETGMIFFKKGNTLQGDGVSLKEIKKIVSEEYFEKHFIKR